MLERLKYLGYVESTNASGELLRRGVSTMARLWAITSDGQIFKMALELYVK